MTNKRPPLNPEVKDRIIALWGDGLTAGDIARRLDISRNSAIGVIYRARKAGVEIDPKGLQKARGSRPNVIPAKTPPKEAKAAPADKKRKPPQPPKPSPQGSGVPLVRLKESGCKYPTGEDRRGRHLFCNAKREGDGPYCAKHHKIAFVKATPIKRALFSWQR